MYKDFSSKFPEKEEESLRILSDIARNLNIEIISISPKPKRVFEAAGRVEEKICQFISVSMEMRGTYFNLVKYIESLKKDLPAFLSIEELRIKKERIEGSLLNIMLTFKLYLLS